MTIPIFLKPIASLTDEELMQRVNRKDDDRAYGELYHRHAHRLMGFFFRQMNGDEALAADLTQDAFMRVWTARNSFSGSNFRTWLLTIGYNLVKNHYRHSEHERKYEQLLVQTQQEGTDNSIIEKMEKDDFDQVLQLLLEKMPPESRMLFSFRFEEELTVPEIAVLMEIPEGTVKSRLHILTQTLKQKFNQYDHIRR